MVSRHFVRRGVALAAALACGGAAQAAVVAGGASFTAVPVPEPGAWAMLAAGLAVLGLRARRRSV